MNRGSVREFSSLFTRADRPVLTVGTAREVIGLPLLSGFEQCDQVIEGFGRSPVLGLEC